MSKIENPPTTVFFAAWGDTEDGYAHTGELPPDQYLGTGQQNLIAETDESAFLEACAAQSVPMPPLPAEGEEVEEGVYDEGGGGLRVAVTSPVLVRVAHVRTGQAPEDEPDNFIKPGQASPPWRAGEQVQIGMVRRHQNKNWRCIQAHRTQGDWTPAATPALWITEPEAGDDWPAWAQPLGAQDAYPFGGKVSHKGSKWISQRRANVWEPGTSDSGWQEQIAVDPAWPLWQQPIPGLPGREPYSISAQVTHNGERWISTNTNNVWEPGVFGWELQEESGTEEWRAGVAYQVGDIVTYEGLRYECRQAHTSISVWMPPAVPALWLLLD